MTDMLVGEVNRLRRAAELLAATGERLPGHDPGRIAFGVDGPGRLGLLSDRLHDQLRSCLAARSREAIAHAGRLEQLAQTLQRAAGGYADIDESARRRSAEASAEGA